MLPSLGQRGLQPKMKLIGSIVLKYNDFATKWTNEPQGRNLTHIWPRRLLRKHQFIHKIPTIYRFRLFTATARAYTAVRKWTLKLFR